MSAGVVSYSILLSAEAYHQDSEQQFETAVLQVLKVQLGSKVKVGIVNGQAGIATVLQPGGDLVLECSQWQQMPSMPQIHLVLAMPRPKVLAKPVVHSKSSSPERDQQTLCISLSNS